MKFLFCIMTLLLISAPGFAAPDADKQERAIRAAIASMNGTEAQPVDAEAKLKSFKRSDVLNILREEFGNGANPAHYLLRAAVVMKATELESELKQVAMKNDRWEVFSAINSIFTDAASASKAGLLDAYQARLANLPPVSKMAAIDGLTSWNKTITKEQFTTFVQDQNFDLRQSAVRNFVVTRSNLSQADQVARFKIALRMKPYQVRLFAMNAFLDLPEKERQTLREAVPANLCDSEKQEKVKKPCARVIASVGTSQKKGGEK